MSKMRHQVIFVVQKYKLWQSRAIFFVPEKKFVQIRSYSDMFP